MPAVAERTTAPHGAAISVPGRLPNSLRSWATLLITGKNTLGAAEVRFSTGVVVDPALSERPPFETTRAAGAASTARAAVPTRARVITDMKAPAEVGEVDAVPSMARKLRKLGLV